MPMTELIAESLTGFFGKIDSYRYRDAPNIRNTGRI